jgi:hypothetical protein
MVGITGWLKLNTKADYTNNYNARVANGEADPLQDYRKLYGTRLNWFDVKDTIETPQVDAETGEPTLDPITNEQVVITTHIPHTVAAIETVDEEGRTIITPAEDAIINDTHRVIYDQSTNVFVQQELLVDYVGSLMALKGFTEAELEGILGL